MDTTLGQRIGEQRKRLNLSQEAFGEKMGVSRQAISKWEADGAMPEIDKLIVMSKLFGVSVGWMLGVEETPEPKQEEAFSEKQLETLEELIRRYQQPAAPAREPRWGLRLLSLLAVVILGVTAIRKLNNQPDYSGQLGNLSANYANLQSQFLDMSHKLEEIAQGERLLSHYEFTGEALPDLSGVRVYFSATPKQWNANDRAVLSIRKDGQEIDRLECAFTGSMAMAQWELPGDDGIYSYCFIRVDENGNQEQQKLENVWLYAQVPSDGLKLTWQGQVYHSWEGKNKLVIEQVFVHLAPPQLLDSRADTRWRSAELHFMLDGEIFETYDLRAMLGSGISSEDYVLSGGFWPDNLSVKLSEGSKVEALIIAETESHYRWQLTVGTWTRTEDEILDMH